MDQALSSIHNQTTNKKFVIEVIICADGIITNEQLKIVNKYNTFRQIVLYNKYKSGLPGNLNTGIEYTIKNNFDFIARMDSDDISIKDRILIQLTFLENNKRILATGSWVYEFDESENIQIIKYPSEYLLMLKLFKLRDPVSHPTLFFRRQFFELVGFYNEDYIKDQDTELWLRTFQKNVLISNVNKPLLYYRVNKKLQERRKSIQRLNKYVLLRFKVSKILKFGLIGYITPILYYIIQLAPSYLRKLAYDKLR